MFLSVVTTGLGGPLPCFSVSNTGADLAKLPKRLRVYSEGPTAALNACWMFNYIPYSINIPACNATICTRLLSTAHAERSFDAKQEEMCVVEGKSPKHTDVTDVLEIKETYSTDLSSLLWEKEAEGSKECYSCQLL